MAELKTGRVCDLCVVWESCGVAEKSNGGDIQWVNRNPSPIYVGDPIDGKRSGGDDEEFE